MCFNCLTLFKVDNLESSGPTGNNESQPSANIEGEAPESSRQPENPRQGRDNGNVLAESVLSNTEVYYRLHFRLLAISDFTLNK